jgi:hypothetical protein
MRISIQKGYHAPVQRLMRQLQTDDPALAVHHIIGCWLAAGSCPVSPTAAPASATPQQAITLDDDFANVLEVSLDS